MEMQTPDGEKRMRPVQVELDLDRRGSLHSKQSCWKRVVCARLRMVKGLSRLVHLIGSLLPLWRALGAADETWDC